MDRVARQLELHGLDETCRLIRAQPAAESEKRRMIRRAESAHDIMSSLPSSDELSFLHSGLCQTCLPHSRPKLNHSVWRRTSGRFTLSITPGTIAKPAAGLSDDGYVGVPFGPKARLILIHLQSEGLRSRKVNLGPSLSAFMRSLGLDVSGGKRGSIAATKEQVLRIARCSFSLQWSDTDENGTRTRMEDHRIVDGLELWEAGTGGHWNGTVQLSERFHKELQQHAVPLDKRAISHLSGNSLGLDLYTLFAYRLPRLKEGLRLSWRMLQSQIGSEERMMGELARRVRQTLPDVMAVYPHARVEVSPKGLLLQRSEPPVMSKVVRGFKLVAA